MAVPGKNVTIDYSSSTFKAQTDSLFKTLNGEMVTTLNQLRDINLFWWLIKKNNFTLFILVVNQLYNLLKQWSYTFFKLLLILFINFSKY